MKQTAPEYIKSQGLPSLVYVAKKVNKDPRTIYKWHESNPELFEVVVAGLSCKRRIKELTEVLEEAESWIEDTNPRAIILNDISDVLIAEVLYERENDGQANYL